MFEVTTVTVQCCGSEAPSQLAEKAMMTEGTYRDAPVREIPDKLLRTLRPVALDP